MVSNNTTALHERVMQTMKKISATDIHTHLYAPQFGALLLWGMDEILTHHYLVAEALRWAPVTADGFWKLERHQQAELVWKTLFLDHSPCSASAQGVLETMKALGMDVQSRDLAAYRAFFNEHRLDEHIAQVFNAAGVESVVMTNDPFDDQERQVWLSGNPVDSRFHAALRLDMLVNSWNTACPRMKQWGYNVELTLGEQTVSEVKRFLREWSDRINALYLAVSLPPSWGYPGCDVSTQLIEKCVLPIARDLRKPFAMMIGVRRQVNPLLHEAGDSVGRAEVASIEHLCAAHPENKFLITLLSRENQHELCVAARKFPNLMIFGCWWFLNIPSLIDEITRMRLELLGVSVIPHHSDVRVLEQVIPKWAHARHITADVLVDRYAEMEAAGWKVADEEIHRDLSDLFVGNFWRFVSQ